MGNQAWGGRFTASLSEAVEALNASVAFDQILALEDIAGSIAHSRMLKKVGLLKQEDHDGIEQALSQIAADIRNGNFEWQSKREDVHMNIEGVLYERIGPLAGRLHTGRSRNDQVALDLRLYLRRQTSHLVGLLLEAVETLETLAQTHETQVMPGYTHLQRAQAITLGHHLSAWAFMLLRDAERLLDARTRFSVSPLGSGALAGSPLPLDRYLVAEELEFPDITYNSLDGVADRDGAMEVLSALSILMVHLSRISEELVLWSSQEFGFIELSDSFCTGSSLMPQKKNPDIPELIRGKSGRVIGDQTALLVLMKGLPLAYNKDMQEDKEPLFDAVKTATEVLSILPALFQAIQVKPEGMKQALKDGFLLATDIADYLVKAGLPFREAHHVVGAMVAYCLSHEKRLEELELTELQSFSDKITEDILTVFDYQRSVAERSLPGGPAPLALRLSLEKMASIRKALKGRQENGGPSKLEDALYEGSPLPAPKQRDCKIS